MSTWIALDHVDADNGAMEFIPGSHAWGKKYRPFLTDQNGAFKEYLKTDDPQYSDMPDFEAERDQHKMLSWDMEPGDMLAFDGYIVHSAKGNRTSTRRRRAYAVRFATEGAVYKPDQGVAPWLEDETLNPGDKFASDKFPVIFGT
jgi:ectoine hydroxylase-related dioxygenase (phytanoyl-CoA dioxygenase family)